MVKTQPPRKRAKDDERNFRLLVQGVVDYAIYMLDPEGVVASWNAGAQRIKGYSDAEIIGQHFSIFYSEADRQNGLPQRALEIARREGKYEAEGWRLRKDGKTFLASVVIDAIRENGELVGFSKITSACQRCDRLRSVYARPQGHREQLECGRSAHQRLCA